MLRSVVIPHPFRSSPVSVMLEETSLFPVKRSLAIRDLEGKIETGITILENPS